MEYARKHFYSPPILWIASAVGEPDIFCRVPWIDEANSAWGIVNNPHNLHKQELRIVMLLKALPLNKGLVFLFQFGVWAGTADSLLFIYCY